MHVEVSKCCCFSLKSGCYIIAYFNMIISLVCSACAITTLPLSVNSANFANTVLNKLFKFSGGFTSILGAVGSSAQGSKATIFSRAAKFGKAAISSVRAASSQRGTNLNPTLLVIIKAISGAKVGVEVTTLLLALISFIFAVMLLIGLYQNKLYLIKAYIVYSLVNIALCFIGLCLLCLIPITIGPVVLYFVICTVLITYNTVVIRSYYLQKRINKPVCLKMVAA